MSWQFWKKRRSLLACLALFACAQAVSAQGLWQVGNDAFGMTIEEVQPGDSGVRVKVLIENLTSSKEVFLHHEANQLNAHDFFFLPAARKNRQLTRDTYVLAVSPEGTISAELFFPIAPGNNPGLLILGSNRPPFEQVAVALGPILRGRPPEEVADTSSGLLQPLAAAPPSRSRPVAAAPRPKPPVARAPAPGAQPRTAQVPQPRQPLEIVMTPAPRPAAPAPAPNTPQRPTTVRTPAANGVIELAEAPAVETGRASSGQNLGQNAGLNSSQNLGQNAGLNSSQNLGQNAGQNSGQNLGQNAGQNSSQNLGQNAGQNSSPTSGQNFGQTSGFGEVPPAAGSGLMEAPPSDGSGLTKAPPAAAAPPPSNPFAGRQGASTRKPATSAAKPGATPGAKLGGKPGSGEFYTPKSGPPQTRWIPVDDKPILPKPAVPKPEFTTPAGGPPQTRWIPVEDTPQVPTQGDVPVSEPAAPPKAPPKPPPVPRPQPRPVVRAPVPPASPTQRKPAQPARPKIVFLPNTPGDRVLQIFKPPHATLGDHLVLRYGKPGHSGYGWARIYAEHPNVKVTDIARAATYPHQVWSDGRSMLYLRWSEDQNGAVVLQVAGDLIVNAQWASYDELLYWLGPGRIYPRLMYQGAR